MSEKPLLGVVMDPIDSIHPYKDTTLALLLKAQARGFELRYMEMCDLSLQYGNAWGRTRPLQVFDDLSHWYTLSDPSWQPLDQFEVILMRKDPPVTMDYIYVTHILERAEQNGCLVINKPQSLRDANEKLFTTWFPQCMPPTLVTCSLPTLKAFAEEHKIIVIKPLDSMGGERVFKCDITDPNLNVILETLTNKGKQLAMAQLYIPEIREGDKRILLIDGDPIPYALARIPASGEFRGNLAAGGQGVGQKLTDNDLSICAQIGPTLREKGLLFVGIDIIGDYLTEINVTSPTCVRELDSAFGLDIAGRMMDCIQDKLEV